jgi:hypothetical protein
MGNQGEADQFCKFDRVDDVGGLDRDVLGAANTVLATMLTLLTTLCCTSA